jgi:HNH endonuclease
MPKLKSNHQAALQAMQNDTRRFFWHNIGNNSNIKYAWATFLEDHGYDRWWNYLVSNGQLSASFDNEPGDRGEIILGGYEAGDVVIAYASECGAIGWGIVVKPVYEYVQRDHDEFSKSGFHRHRLNGIKWQSCSPTLRNAVSATEMRERFGLHFPIQTKSMVPREKAQALIAVLDHKFGSRLPQETSQLMTQKEQEAESAGAFEPQSLKDDRERSIASIVRRRGQPEFRQKLLREYGNKCAVSGCDAVEALEAAHIIPYQGVDTNHLSNGLILRGDLHTLFDLGLLTVDADLLTVVLSQGLKQSSYGELHGKSISVPESAASRPSREALKQHRAWCGL